ncbi:phthiocerol/phthiodiolone dimycocerosyl transferase family protein [Bifidobacterium gallicum]|uniref:Alcohol acetyltransferase n=1 Tax=Bifidobacterium gallicum DSM 20093 = LMG 11596 TaxID=561180 RepID=D1NUN4_9BIFI|nr:hypothetical protein [Bifidobacterium gallicum]EFA22535.1 alcohol acetyltransferase [Bifidobacterium gallicum DSM 20093 = LMG 11596]KFI59526.1 alcohol acetyltransferase [Bifidobacterium gallicum DSM 20093 = LMG 11596]
MADHSWYRLDNVGKFYSSQAGRSLQTVFRYAAGLVDDIDADILQHALDRAVRRFPSFNVRLRNGLFWHYLEQSDEQPQVEPEHLPICSPLHHGPMSTLFRVTYYRDRINLEVSHMISDGRGALNFFKAILHEYIAERYDVPDVPSEYLGSDSDKAENSFDKFYDRNKKTGQPTTKIFRIPGFKDRSAPTFLEYHVSVDAILNHAHLCGASLTSFLIAAIICSIRSTMPTRSRNRAIRVDIPVDLRKFYSSETVRNFYGMTYVAVTPGDDDMSLEDMAREVQQQLRSAAGRERVEGYMNTMVGLEKNVALRLAPSPIKDWALEAAQHVTEHSTTTTVSSVGRFELDERLQPFVHTANFLTTPGGLNFTIISCKNNLSIGVSSVYHTLDIVKNLVRLFATLGIEGYINIAGANVEQTFPASHKGSDHRALAAEDREEDELIDTSGSVNDIDSSGASNPVPTAATAHDAGALKPDMRSDHTEGSEQ